MAEVRPFRATLYNVEKAGDMASLICPPYDVIGPALEQDLYRRSPYNFVRLEKAQPEPGDASRDDRYFKTKDLLEKWFNQGIMVKGRLPVMFMHDHFFTYKGREYRRRGFIATVRLEEWHKMIIRPHEGTLASPKADRVKLISTLKANTSSVFAMYEDSGGVVARLLEEQTKVEPLFDITLESGERHIVREVSAPQTLVGLGEFFIDKPLYLADGHHRYESALTYQKEQRALHGSDSGEEGYNFVLTTLVDMADPGLIVLPPHRLVRSLPAFLIEQLERGVETFFDITSTYYRSGGWSEVEQAFSRSEADLALFGPYDNRLRLLKVKDYGVVERLMPYFHSSIYKRLDVAIVDHIILEEILGIRDSASGVDLAFSYDYDKAISRVLSGEYQLALLLRPVNIETIKAIADAGDQMPRKSTYFYPKLPSGIVFYHFG